MTTPQHIRTRRRAGVAMIEAVIALPFFAIILAGIMYVGQQIGAKQTLIQEARQCAFRYALAGCGPKQGLPERCHRALSTGDSGANTRSELERAGAPGILDDLAEVEYIGGLFEGVFGRTTAAHVQSTGGRPLLLGGGEFTTVASARLLCNEKPVHGGILDTLWGLWF